MVDGGLFVENDWMGGAATVGLDEGTFNKSIPGLAKKQKMIGQRSPTQRVEEAGGNVLSLGESD